MGFKGALIIGGGKTAVWAKGSFWATRRDPPAGSIPGWRREPEIGTEQNDRESALTCSRQTQGRNGF